MNAAAPLDLQEVIYVSTLADDAPVRVVASIAHKARIYNQQAQITGLLVFDGVHFCQQLEGRAAHIDAVMDRISQDPRHHQLAVVHNGRLDKRRFHRFSLGYTSVEDIELLVRLQQLQGPAALNAFLGLIGDLDLDN